MDGLSYDGLATWSSCTVLMIDERCSSSPPLEDFDSCYLRSYMTVSWLVISGYVGRFVLLRVVLGGQVWPRMCSRTCRRVLSVSVPRTAHSHRRVHLLPCRCRSSVSTIGRWISSPIYQRVVGLTQCLRALNATPSWSASRHVAWESLLLMRGGSLDFSLTGSYGTSVSRRRLSATEIRGSLEPFGRHSCA